MKFNHQIKILSIILASVLLGSCTITNQDSKINTSESTTIETTETTETVVTTENSSDSIHLAFKEFFDDYTAEEFYDKNTSALITNGSSNEKNIEYADLTLDNFLFVHPTWDPVKIEELTWTEDPYDNSSWQLYFQSLDMVYYLTDAFGQTENLNYLTKAEYFILDWISKNPTDQPAKTGMTWNDHASSNRAKNIINFMSTYIHSDIFDYENYQNMVYSLYEHGLFLADDANYAENNHGIMTDQALIEISLLFDSMPQADNWYDIAISRIHDSISRDITSEGVSKEHSTFYHNYVKWRYNQINSFLLSQDVNDSTLQSTIKSMDEFSKYFITPAGYYPQIGDTNRDKLQDADNYASLEDKIYPDSGYAFFRGNSDIKEEQLYLMFVSAYHSHVHKQKDDLSFVLSLGLTDYFVDGGYYSYELGPRRTYLRSMKSHNTFTVNNEEWDYDEDKFGVQQITNYEINDEYSYVRASHNLYEDFEVTRTLIYLRPDIIFIHDSVSAEENLNTVDSIEQIFNIGPDVSILEIDENQFRLESDIEDNYIELHFLDNISTIDRYNGSTEPYIGWQSPKFNEIQPINTLIRSSDDSVSEIFTQISINHSNEPSTIHYNSDESVYEIYIGNQYFKIAIND